MLKRFIYYYKPHRKMLTLDMLASLLISVIGMVYPIVTNKMLNVYIPEKMYTTIVLAGLVVLALYIVRMLLRYFVQYYGHVIGVKMQSQMRQDLFAHLEKQPFQRHRHPGHKGLHQQQAGNREIQRGRQAVRGRFPQSLQGHGHVPLLHRFRHGHLQRVHPDCRGPVFVRGQNLFR